MTEQVSTGGRTITGAKGRSLTLTAKETVPLTDRTSLTVTASADRFLGGEASIPLGTVTLTGGDWQPRLSLATETAIVPGMSFMTRAGTTGEKDYSLGAGLRLTF